MDNILFEPRDCSGINCMAGLFKGPIKAHLVDFGLAESTKPTKVDQVKDYTASEMMMALCEKMIDASNAENHRNVQEQNQNAEENTDEQNEN